MVHQSVNENICAMCFAVTATIEDARSWADAITAALTAKTITEC